MHNDCGALKFGEGTLEKFIEHALARGRHVDLGLADEQIATKAFDVIKQKQALLKVGDNTLTGTTNGIEKSFKAFVKDGKIISVNICIQEYLVELLRVQ